MTSASLRAPYDFDLKSVFEAVGKTVWEQLRGKRIFLTGGTGFVGKWLLASLIYANEKNKLDCSITVLSRRPKDFLAEAPFLGGYRLVNLQTGDIRDFDFPAGQYDFVIHAATDVVAASDPLDIFDSCAQGTRRVLDFAVHASVNRVLLVSSGAMYGNQPDSKTGVAEDFTGAPVIHDIRSAYGEGKRVTEWLGAAYSHKHAIDIRVARCFAFVGPYLPLDKHFALGNFMRDAMKNASIVINGDGSALRTYLYAADMATWLWAILLAPTPNITYNVGGKEIVSIAQLAKRILKISGSSAQLTINKQPAIGMAPDRYVPDLTKIEVELALPAPLSLNEAIARTLAWHCQNNETDCSQNLL